MDRTAVVTAVPLNGLATLQCRVSVKEGGLTSVYPHGAMLIHYASKYMSASALGRSQLHHLKT